MYILMALDKFFTVLFLSISVTNAFIVVDCSEAIRINSSINSCSMVMLVLCLPAIKTDFFNIYFFLKASIETTLAISPDAFFGDSSSAKIGISLSSSLFAKLKPNLAKGSPK